MSHEVTHVSDGYGEGDEVTKLYKDASQVASGLHAKTEIFGNVVVIKEAEKLGPSAYSTDDVGVKSFKAYNHYQSWLAENSFEGKLEGRGSLSPDQLYIFMLCKDGTLYLMFVKADYENTMKDIEMERQELLNRLYMTWMKDKFANLIKNIQIEKQSKSIS